MKNYFTKKNILFALIIAPLVAIGGCKAIKQGVESVNKGIAKVNNYSHPISEDIELGDKVVKDIAKDSKTYPILNNAPVKAYLKDMMDQILASPEIKYKSKFNYTIDIINDDNTINAFATPGGHVYVYTGLLKMLDNEATLAGVIGHEIGHAESRHTMQRMANAGYLQKGADLALGSYKNSNTDAAANLFSGLALLKNSRDDEFQADECSFNYLKSTKWYAGAIKLFFDKVKGKSSSSAGSLETLLSTHPMPKERIDAVNDRIKKNKIPPPMETNLLSQAYLKFKKLLN